MTQHIPLDYQPDLRALEWLEREKSAGRAVEYDPAIRSLARLVAVKAEAQAKFILDNMKTPEAAK